MENKTLPPPVARRALRGYRDPSRKGSLLSAPPTKEALTRGGPGPALRGTPDTCLHSTDRLALNPAPLQHRRGYSPHRRDQGSERTRPHSEAGDGVQTQRSDPSRPPSFRPLEGEAGKKGAGLGQGSRKRGRRLRVQRALPPARSRRSSFLCSGALGAADRAPDGGPCPQLGSVGVLTPSSTPGTGVACARPPRPSKAPGPWGGAGQVAQNRLRQWQGDGWRWGHPTLLPIGCYCRGLRGPFSPTVCAGRRVPTERLGILGEYAFRNVSPSSGRDFAGRQGHDDSPRHPMPVRTEVTVWDKFLGGDCGVRARARGCGVGRSQGHPDVCELSPGGQGRARGLREATTPDGCPHIRPTCPRRPCPRGPGRAGPKEGQPRGGCRGAKASPGRGRGPPREDDDDDTHKSPSDSITPCFRPSSALSGRI